MHVTDLIGKPFVDGGRGPEAYDCWGLCVEVFRRQGVELRDYKLCCHDSAGFDGLFQEALSQWERREEPNIPAPSVVAIRFNHPVFINHVGVYIGNGRFLHTREKTGVVVERIDSPCWRDRVEGFYTPTESEVNP